MNLPIIFLTNLTFSPSLIRESSNPSIGSLPSTTMASADFLILQDKVSPQVRAHSFFRFLPHLLIVVYWLWTLQRCACLSTSISLVCGSCSSVPEFVVSLPSVLGSLHTTLRLTNRLYQMPVRDLHSLEYLASSIPGAHAGHTQHLQEIGGSVLRMTVLWFNKLSFFVWTFVVKIVNFL